MSTLTDNYTENIAPKLMEGLGIKNKMRAPKISKVVVNMGMGIVDKDVLKKHMDELASITGQRPLLRKAKKSISNFKLREGMSIGAKVTLRGANMFEFMERLVNVALPRIRDFRGVSNTGFDGRGNYTLGIKQLEIFPEIDPNNLTVNQGMNITIVTTAASDEEANQLLKLYGMPFAE